MTAADQDRNRQEKKSRGSHEPRAILFYSWNSMKNLIENQTYRIMKLTQYFNHKIYTNPSMQIYKFIPTYPHITAYFLRNLRKAYAAAASRNTPPHHISMRCHHARGRSTSLILSTG